MGRFITRVELHAGKAEDYEKLHEAMEAKGFSRQITGSSGRTYWLPTAQYFLESSTLALSDVLQKAKLAAQSVGKRFAILVTHSTSKWTGLEEVDE